MFDNYLLASPKQIKLCPRYYIFPIKQEDICDYNPLCFISGGLMLDNIIMNLFKGSTKQTTDSVKKGLFSNIQDDTIYLYKGSLQDYSWKKLIAHTKKTLRSHHFIEKQKLRIYLSGILSIDIDEADIERKTNKFINDISDFNNKHIIQCYNKTIFNIPKEPRFISSTISPVFINGQYE